MYKQIYLIIKTLLLFIFWFLFFVLTVWVLEELVGLFFKLFFNIGYYRLWYSSLGPIILRFISITSLGITYFSSKKFKPKYLSSKAHNISWLIILGCFISGGLYSFFNPMQPMEPWDSKPFPQQYKEGTIQEELSIDSNEYYPFEDL